VHTPGPVVEISPAAPLRLALDRAAIIGLLVLVLTIDGVDMQILGVTVSAMAAEWQSPLTAFGAAMSAGHMGAAIGATLGGVLADRIGRRLTILMGVAWFGAFTIATLLTHTPEQVAFVRLGAGLGLGGCLPPALALTSEIFPERIRPLAVSLCIVASPFGIAISGLSAGLLIPAYGWQGMYLVFGLLPFVALLVLLFFLPESPAFLARIPRRRAEYIALTQRLEIDRALTEQAASRVKAPLSALLVDKKWVILSLFVVFFCVYLAMSMVLSWMPALLMRGGFTQVAAGGALSAFSFVGMAGILLAGLLMGAFGIRLVSLAYIFGAAAAVAVQVVFLQGSPDAIADPVAHTSLLVVIGGMGFALNGAMTCLFAYASSTLAPAIRATGIGLAATCGRIGAITGAFIGAWVMETFGFAAFFGIVATMLALAFSLLATSGVGGDAPPATAAERPLH
jgi:AAHS family 4-hydroxybenzoate transporter-like MFS transporter